MRKRVHILPKPPGRGREAEVVVTSVAWLGKDLGAFLRVNAPADVARALEAFATAALPLADIIRRGAGADIRGAAAGPSTTGLVEKPLDVLADELLVAGLEDSGLRAIVSGKRGDPLLLDPRGMLLAAVDPLDGVTNVDANMSIGAVFSVLDARDGGLKADFLQPGTRQRAAGFVIYGPHVAFFFTIGAGVHAATLNPDADLFRVSRIDAHIPADTREFAINASNSRHWPEPVRAYVEDCLEDEESPRGKNYDMRWGDSIVADAYRILARGGLCLYPEESREGHPNGRVGLLWQANPIAFLIEQAGGAAIDGFDRILDIAPRSIDARTPLIFGSKDKVERIAGYYREDDAPASAFPLFRKRGLLRR